MSIINDKLLQNGSAVNKNNITFNSDWIQHDVERTKSKVEYCFNISVVKKKRKKKNKREILRNILNSFVMANYLAHRYS